MVVVVEFKKTDNYFIIQIEKDFEICIDIKHQRVFFDNPSGYDSIASCSLDNISTIITSLGFLDSAYKSWKNTNGN